MKEEEPFECTQCQRDLSAEHLTETIRYRLNPAIKNVRISKKPYLNDIVFIRLTSGRNKLKILTDTNSNKQEVKQFVKDLNKSHKLLALIICSHIHPEKRFETLLGLVNKFRKILMKTKAVDTDESNLLYKQIPALNNKFKNLFKIDIIAKTDTNQYMWSSGVDQIVKLHLNDGDLTEKSLIKFLTDVNVIRQGRPAVPEEEKKAGRKTIHYPDFNNVASPNPEDDPAETIKPGDSSNDIQQD